MARLDANTPQGVDPSEWTVGIDEIGKSFAEAGNGERLPIIRGRIEGIFESSEGKISYIHAPLTEEQKRSLAELREAKRTQEAQGTRERAKKHLQHQAARLRVERGGEAKPEELSPGTARNIDALSAALKASDIIQGILADPEHPNRDTLVEMSEKARRDIIKGALKGEGLEIEIQRLIEYADRAEERQRRKKEAQNDFRERVLESETAQRIIAKKDEDPLEYRFFSKEIERDLDSISTRDLAPDEVGEMAYRFLHYFSMREERGREAEQMEQEEEIQEGMERQHLGERLSERKIRLRKLYNEGYKAERKRAENRQKGIGDYLDPKFREAFQRPMDKHPYNRRKEDEKEARRIQKKPGEGYELGAFLVSDIASPILNDSTHPQNTLLRQLVGFLRREGLNEEKTKLTLGVAKQWVKSGQSSVDSFCNAFAAPEFEDLVEEIRAKEKLLSKLGIKDWESSIKCLLDEEGKFSHPSLMREAVKFVEREVKLGKADGAWATRALNEASSWGTTAKYDKYWNRRDLDPANFSKAPEFEKLVRYLKSRAAKKQSHLRRGTKDQAKLSERQKNHRRNSAAKGKAFEQEALLREKEIEPTVRWKEPAGGSSQNWESSARLEAERGEIEKLEREKSKKEAEQIQSERDAWGKELSRRKAREERADDPMEERAMGMEAGDRRKGGNKRRGKGRRPGFAA